MNQKIPSPYFLIALIIVASGITFFIFRPFLIVLVLAAVFAVVLQPLYQGILGHMRSWPGLAAFITLVISVVGILVPLTFITVQIVGEAQQLYTALADGSGKTYLTTVVMSANDVIAQYVPNLALSGVDVSTALDQYIQGGLAWLVRDLGGALEGVARLLLSLFIFSIALYYFLRDGASLKQTIIGLSPLRDTDDTTVFLRLELAVNSVVRGSLMIALIQGILTAIGFAFFGVPGSILWGVVAALAALIPSLGTSLVLVPGIAYLYIIGETVPAIGLLVWGVLAVGLIDNFLGPRLMGRGMHLHPLVVLLSVFGGLALFGPVGVFLGPLCTSLLFALLSIYSHISKKYESTEI